MSYIDAARSVGRRSNDAVSQLVSRFNQEGLVALEVRHTGRLVAEYGRVDPAHSEATRLGRQPADDDR